MLTRAFFFAFFLRIDLLREVNSGYAWSVNDLDLAIEGYTLAAADRLFDLLGASLFV